MPDPKPPKTTEVRGKKARARLDVEPAALDEVTEQTTRLWWKHHRNYDQTKYVLEQARRRLELQAPRNRKRTEERLDLPEIERLIQAGLDNGAIRRKVAGR